MEGRTPRRTALFVAKQGWDGEDSSIVANSFDLFRKQLQNFPELGILFNCAPVCARQPRPAASTSIFIACFWEHHATHAHNSFLRKLCRYQVIAILTTLRFKELKRARVTSPSQLSLMVSLTKDGSHDMWVGAPLEGFLGPITWWPEFAAPRLSLRYMVRDPILGPGCRLAPHPDHLIGFRDAPVEATRAALLVKLAYAYAGVTPALHRVTGFNARSSRHLFPNIAHALRWSEAAADETGRWSSHLDATRSATDPPPA
jgi:hypothetical protein